MHDVPGNDGTPPSAFRALARQEILSYASVTLTNGTVTAIVPSNHTNTTTTPPFLIATLNRTMFISRRVILATGMRDILPLTPGIVAAWGKGLYWCSWCDGWEHKDKPYANLAPFSASAVNSTITNAQTLNPESVLLTNGTATASARALASQALPSWEERLKRYNITLDDRVIKSFGRVGGNASDYDADFVVSFEDGGRLVRNAVKASFPAELASTLPKEMGLRLGMGAGGEEEEVKVMVDEHMESSRSGVFVVGDANSDGSTNVVHALWSAKRAVVHIHRGLGREYADELIAREKEKKKKKDEEGKLKRGIEMEESWESVKKQLRVRSGNNVEMTAKDMVRYVNE